MAEEVELLEVWVYRTAGLARFYCIYSQDIILSLCISIEKMAGMHILKSTKIVDIETQHTYT